MMDFFVRELRAVVDGPLAILRFGTCGGLSVDAPPGTVVCASHGAAFVSRNYDYFSDPRGAGEPYQIHRVSDRSSDMKIPLPTDNFFCSLHKSDQFRR